MAIDQNNKGDIFAAHLQSASTAVLTIVAARSAPSPTTTRIADVCESSPTVGVITMVATVTAYLEQPFVDRHRRLP